MEKIKIKNVEYDIVSINQRGNLLEIVFPTPTDLRGKNLSRIDLYTSGGVLCAEITGYMNIYRANGNTVILSKDATPYVPDPVVPNPVDPVPSGPTEIEIRLDGIEATLDNISNAIVFMTLM